MGGKSTILPVLSSYYKDKGFKVYTTPEVATLMWHSGISIHEKHERQTYDLAHSILTMQIAIEDSYFKLAQSDEKAIVLCDRGTMDGAGYTPPDLWQKLLNVFEESNESLLSRYDLVVHLTTAAYGAEAAFEVMVYNNSARTGCTLEIARQLDDAMKVAWSPHKNYHQILNTTDFSGKIERTKQVIDAHLELGN